MSCKRLQQAVAGPQQLHVGLQRAVPRRVFTQIQQFLTNIPREVIIIPLEINDRTSGSVRLSEIDLLLRQIVGKTMKRRLYVHPVRPVRNPWPTLAEMIDVDKRIVLAH